MSAPQPTTRPRIRRRLALIAAAATGTVMLAFCVPLAFFVRTVAYDRAIDAAELQARSLGAELSGVHDLTTIRRIARQANSAAISDATVYLAGGMATAGRGVRPARSTLAGIPKAVRVRHVGTTTAAGSARDVWEPVHRSTALAVVVQVPAGELAKGVIKTWIFLFGGGAVLVLLAVGLADRLGRSIVRPLLALEDVTHRLRDGDLAQRYEPAGPYEVAEVGQAVNELADRINGLIASARVAASDLGHRLRTPLTALRLDIEAIAAEGDRARLAAALESVETAVSRLIEESREAPKPASRRSDLSQAVRDRMTFWSLLAKSQKRPVDVRAPSRRVDVPLSRDELDAAIDALLSNVFAHTPEGTAFSVQLRPAAAASQSWSLVVEDRGPGAGLQPSANGKPRGTGLGLDIVRRTATQGGGAAEVGRSASGGYRVEIRLPLAAPDA